MHKMCRLFSNKNILKAWQDERDFYKPKGTKYEHK